MAIFTRFLIQCVWDYESRTGILSNSLDASDNQYGLENFVLESQMQTRIGKKLIRASDRVRLCLLT